MTDFYKYIYYRIYSWNYYLWKNQKMAAYNSTLGITFSVVALFFCIKIYAERLIETKIISFFDNVYTSIGFVGIIFLINYRLFEQNEKYLKIAEKYDSNKGNKTNWLINGFWAFFIALAPIFTYIFLL